VTAAGSFPITLNQTPEGPYFVYDSAPDLFLGRTGRGPLEVVWDTSVLIDYFEYGGAMWEGEDLAIADDEYRAEVEGLNIIINLWTRRDIRFHVLDRTVKDAKKRQLSAERVESRRHAVGELAAALRLDMWADDRQERSRREALTDASGEPLPPSEARLQRLPKGIDRDLVRDAVTMGAHVFLTRDKPLLRHAESIKAHRLLLLSPLDLVEELAACGALLALLKPETAYWPLPDLQRMTHLINAIGHD